MFEFARLNRKKDATADRAVVHEGKRQSDADFEDMGDESPLFRCVSVGLVRFQLFWQEILTIIVVVLETDIQFKTRFVLGCGSRTRLRVLLTINLVYILFGLGLLESRLTKSSVGRISKAHVPSRRR